MARIKISLSIGLIILISSTIFIQNASANWYAMYSTNPDRYYGVWAMIRTPPSQPHIALGDHTSHSVSTPGGNRWIQAGWINWPGETPYRYYEFMRSTDEDPTMELRGSQQWNTEIKYEVSQDGNPALNRWCAWIDGIREVCDNDLATIPTFMIIQSEDHLDPLETAFYTKFNSIFVRDNAGIWRSLNLSNNKFYADLPYRIVKLTLDSFLTFRYGASLPLIKK